MTGFVTKEVLWDVRAGSESRIKSTRVQGAVRAVGAMRAGGKGTAGLPLGGGEAAVGVTQNGKDSVFPPGWGRGHRSGRRT